MRRVGISARAALGWIGAGLAAAMLLAACEDRPVTGPPPPARVSALRGVLASETQRGSISISVAPPPATRAARTESPETATGTLHLIGGDDVALAGSFDQAFGTFNASGGGYTLIGTLLDGVMDGSYTGPAGDGLLTMQDASSASVQIFCGAYTQGEGSGTLDLVVGRDGLLSGLLVPSGSAPSRLSGSATGDAFTISRPEQPDFVFARGSIAPGGGSASGSITAQPAGSFSATTSGCAA